METKIGSGNSKKEIYSHLAEPTRSDCWVRSEEGSHSDLYLSNTCDEAYLGLISVLADGITEWLELSIAIQKVIFRILARQTSVIIVYRSITPSECHSDKKKKYLSSICWKRSGEEASAVIKLQL